MRDKELRAQCVTDDGSRILAHGTGAKKLFIRIEQVGPKREYHSVIIDKESALKLAKLILDELEGEE